MRISRNGGAGSVLRAALLMTALGAGLGATTVAAQSTDGAQIYQDRCVRCHRPEGAGIRGVYPRLVGNRFVLQAKDSAVEVVIAGHVHNMREMPYYGDILSNEQIAAVMTYIRTHWGNHASPVTAQEVASDRSKVSIPKPEKVSLPAGWEKQGEQLAHDYCTACHGQKGTDDIYPPLGHNAFVTSVPDPLIYTVLHGRGGMPSFASLPNKQLAYILSYVRTHWGNDGSLISPEMVSKVGRPRPSY